MKMMNNIKQIMEEYKPNYDIMTEDDDMMLKVKMAVENLEDADRIIFILYCETRSLRKVGKMLGVSHTSIYKVIKEIKGKILSQI